MKLIDNWRTVLWRSWAVRISLLNAALAAAETYFQLFNGHISPLAFASIQMGIGILAGMARIVKQAAISGDGPVEQ